MIELLHQLEPAIARLGYRPRGKFGKLESSSGKGIRRNDGNADSSRKAPKIAVIEARAPTRFTRAIHRRNPTLQADSCRYARYRDKDRQSGQL